MNTENQEQQGKDAKKVQAAFNINVQKLTAIVSGPENLKTTRKVKKDEMTDLVAVRDEEPRGSGDIDAQKARCPQSRNRNFEGQDQEAGEGLPEERRRVQGHFRFPLSLDRQEQVASETHKNL